MLFINDGDECVSQGVVPLRDSCRPRVLREDGCFRCRAVRSCITSYMYELHGRYN